MAEYGSAEISLGGNSRRLFVSKKFVPARQCATHREIRPPHFHTRQKKIWARDSLHNPPSPFAARPCLGLNVIKRGERCH